ncbi:MAG: hypothetical protein ACRDL7_06435, partial [Gaiellaceae bacterium]
SNGPGDAHSCFGSTKCLRGAGRRSGGEGLAATPGRGASSLPRPPAARSILGGRSPALTTVTISTLCAPRSVPDSARMTAGKGGRRPEESRPRRCRRPHSSRRTAFGHPPGGAPQPRRRTWSRTRFITRSTSSSAV